MRSSTFSARMSLLGLVLIGCGDRQPAADPPPPQPTGVESPGGPEAGEDVSGDGDTGHGVGHQHVAPHGGALAELGDHFAQLEVVVDPAAGQLTLYVLDGEAERPFRIVEPTVTAEVITSGEPFDMELEAVANVLTGERAGDSSEFRGRASALVDATEASVRIETITVRGQTFDNVRLRWTR